MKVSPDRIKARAELIRRGLRVRNSLELNAGARSELEKTESKPQSGALEEGEGPETSSQRDEQLPMAS